MQFKQELIIPGRIKMKSILIALEVSCLNTKAWWLPLIAFAKHVVYKAGFLFPRNEACLLLTSIPVHSLFMLLLLSRNRRSQCFDHSNQKQGGDLFYGYGRLSIFELPALRLHCCCGTYYINLQDLMVHDSLLDLKICFNGSA